MQIKMRRFVGTEADTAFKRYIARDVPIIESAYKTGMRDSIDREIILWYY